LKCPGNFSNFGLQAAYIHGQVTGYYAVKDFAG
jgi:hypothetical protein